MRLVTHLIKDNEYGENWCPGKYERDEDSTYEIDEVTCGHCLLALVDAGRRAQGRINILGYPEIP